MERVGTSCTKLSLAVQGDGGFTAAKLAVADAVQGFLEGVSDFLRR